MCSLGHRFILNLKFILNFNFILNLKPYLSQRRPKEGQGNLQKFSNNPDKLLKNQIFHSAATLLGPNLGMSPCNKLIFRAEFSEIVGVHPVRLGAIFNVHCLGATVIEWCLAQRDILLWTFYIFLLAASIIIILWQNWLYCKPIGTAQTHSVPWSVFTNGAAEHRHSEEAFGRI